MIDGSLKLWAVIVLVGAANFLSRLSFIALLAHATLPAPFARALRFVGVAMLTALVLPMVVAPAGGAFDWTNPRVPAAVVAGVVALFTRSSLWTLTAGMVALWLIRALAG